jgi:hypothetical protein
MNDRKTATTITDADLDELYNALDGAYRERAHLVAHLAALYPAHIGHTDPNAPDWPVLIIETPAGQMSWHFAERDLDLVGHVQPTEAEHRGWDGHSTEEKYERLRALTVAPRTAEDAAARVLAAIHIADDEDVTDWQRGYRACAVNARRALDDPASDAVVTACQPLTRQQMEAVRAAGLPPGTHLTRAVVDEALRQAQAERDTAATETQEHPAPAITTGLVVQPYRADDGTPKWVFRCWGTDTCDGWLSLDHYNQQSAERARDRHIAEAHAEEQPHA